MSVYDLLLEEDREKIINYIRWFGPLSDNSSIPSIGDIKAILNEWDIQKSKTLEKLFGESLILNRPYTYTITQEGVIKEIQYAIDHHNRYYDEMKKWFKHIFYRPEWDNTISYGVFCLSEDLFKVQTLAANAYNGDVKKIIFPDGEVLKITKGMKPMKIIHKFVNKFNDTNVEQMYENFRNWHSQLLNQIHLDGELCLSIHPLDFMTMSDNGGSWNSCMRWQGEHEDERPGDYRMGTVECMNSPYIVVAYLHNPKHQMSTPEWIDDDEWTWNKKKWRELFIINDGIITEIKGYPFQDENLTNTVLMWLKDLAKKNLGWDYDDIEVNVTSSIDRNNKKYHLAFHPYEYMYNDFGTLQIHRGRINLENLCNRANSRSNGFYLTSITSADGKYLEDIIDIPYGGKATCMCCGTQVPYYENRSDSVMCLNCESTSVCPCCGEYFDDEGYMVNAFDSPICPYCWEYETSMDEISENSELSSSLIELKFYLGDDADGYPVFYDNTIWTLSPTEYYCYEYEKLFNQPPKVYHNRYSETYYVTIDMVKDMNWFEDLFGIDDSYENILVDYGLSNDDNEED